MKKVLIFSLAYYPRVGGAEVAIKAITDRLPDIEWHMITKRFSAGDVAQEKVGSVFVYRIAGPKILFPLVAALKARRLHRLQKFDAAWAMMSYMILPLLLSRIGLPYALTLQEGDTEYHMFGRLRILPFLPLIRSGFNGAAVVQAISTYLGGWARKQGFAGPLEILPNGVDVSHFSGDRVVHEGTVLVTSSRLVRKNGIDTVIRALPLLPEAQFVVCGTGPDEKTLKQLAKELGVDGRIHWRGHVDHSLLPRYLHHADIFVRPSRSEGMGNSFIEAMAAGLPVIATREGGLKDFITPDVAWPVEKDRPDQIALQIKDILGNPPHTAKVIEAAKKLVSEKYDWDLLAAAMRERVFSRLFDD